MEDNIESANGRLFGGGATFDLTTPRSRPLLGCTQMLLLRFHLGRGCATVLDVGVQFRSLR